MCSLQPSESHARSHAFMQPPEHVKSVRMGHAVAHLPETAEVVKEHCFTSSCSLKFYQVDQRGLTAEKEQCLKGNIARGGNHTLPQAYVHDARQPFWLVVLKVKTSTSYLP